ncbi:ligand-binding sensor domain-containing protein [Chondrinema litorale]|uniref:ligand-binding sensor domain-containing protein n=1 Tax=Chondrinema litorale TaxID=2994555 RepID=UPI0025433AA7|nr:two-component regulator propeller domain-containing protein [Chondrinema litorale]UZR97426.1 hypothetical protein OQ292_26825 [Chondrinema litorale]
MKKSIPRYLYSSFFTLVFFVISVPRFAQKNYSLQQENIPEELTNKYITSILQDKYGYMWFGTNMGLLKYNGYSIKTYQLPLIDTTEMDSQRNITVTSLSEANNGNIWVGGLHGEIALFDRKNNRLVPFDMNHKSRNFYSGKPTFRSPSDSSIITVADSLHALNNPDSMITSGSITEIYQDLDGSIWTSVSNSFGFYRFFPDSNSFHNKFGKVDSVKWMVNWNNNLKVTYDCPINFFEDSKENMWITGFNGILKIDSSKSNQELFLVNEEYNTYNFVNAFLQKSIFVDDSLIIAT